MGVMTKTGDNGNTGVFNQRVEKDSVLVETLGTLDEAMCAIILMQAESSLDRLEWEPIIQDLIHICSIIAGFPVKSFNLTERVTALETAIEAKQTAFSGFIYPFDDPRKARIHWTRTIVRRAERQCIRLHKQQELSLELLVYMNRLSDFIFVHLND